MGRGGEGRGGEGRGGEGRGGEGGGEGRGGDIHLQSLHINTQCHIHSGPTISGYRALVSTQLYNSEY